MSSACPEYLHLFHTISASLKTVTVHLPSVARPASIMDHKSLVSIAQRAILQVLNYHFLSTEKGGGQSALDQKTRDTISANIQRNLPLVAFAQDCNKAYLEVVCDAALPIAEKYNINKRWFYTAVQGLTSMELVPNLYENAAVPLRLSTIDGDFDGEIARFEDQEADHKWEEDTVVEEATQDPERPLTDADM